MLARGGAARVLARGGAVRCVLAQGGSARRVEFHELSSKFLIGCELLQQDAVQGKC